MFIDIVDLYDDLVHYFKYASSAYSFVCLRPNGNTLVLQVFIRFNRTGFEALKTHPTLELVFQSSE